MSGFEGGAEPKAHMEGAQPVATRLQPLALIDKCIGSRLWILTKVRKAKDKDGDESRKSLMLKSRPLSSLLVIFIRFAASYNLSHLLMFFTICCVWGFNPFIAGKQGTCGDLERI